MALLVRAAPPPAAAARPGRTAITAQSPMRRRRTTASSAAGTSSKTVFERLEGKHVFRASDRARVELRREWSDDDLVLLLAIQLRRDIKPLLDESETGLKFVSIGTVDRANDFAQETDFPLQDLYADPENECYDALDLYKGVGRTFFSVDTPFAIKKRMDEDNLGDLKEILPRWKPWIPPKSSQGLQQGGVFLLSGKDAIYEHKDTATGAHADFSQVLERIRKYRAEGN